MQLDPTVAFYDAIANEYTAQLAQKPGDRWVRSAFQSMVGELIPKGSHLLDFGCGTGVDAACYAQQGYRVKAYDNSPGMMAELARGCAAWIQASQITPICLPYADFLAHAQTLTPPPLRAIVANFAVLNLITDLPPLFATFARLVEPGGYVAISILNPFFWKDLLTANWWRLAHFEFAAGRVRIARTPVDTYCHLSRHVDRVAAPAFRKVAQASYGGLIRQYRGTQAWEQPTTFAARLEKQQGDHFPLNRTGKYVFLVYQRRNEQLNKKGA